MKSIKTALDQKLLFWLALAFIVYMPLHVLIVQWFSLATGGIEVWKAAKDVLIFSTSPLLVYLSYRRGLWSDKNFRMLLILGGLYASAHGAYLLLDGDDHNLSTVIATVYNTRLLAYLLLGYIVGSARNGAKYLKYLMTAVVVIAGVVALFGVAQYFLPPDFLTHFGYSLERGVKPLFFIDDKPEFPRVMSTLKDPNSLGAYLILPLLAAGWAFADDRVNKGLFVRSFRRSTLAVLASAMFLALLLTFSRGALLALIVSLIVWLALTKGQAVWCQVKRFWTLGAVALIILLGIFGVVKDTHVVQNVVFHADEATVLADPNELRVTLFQEAVEDVANRPQGYGPGTAGLVAIRNPHGGVLTENYYLQIAYEIGWFGAGLFVGILAVLVISLYKLRTNYGAVVLLSSLVGCLFYSLLIHLWSNEALAFQWWLLAGVVLGLAAKKYLTD